MKKLDFQAESDSVFNAECVRVTFENGNDLAIWSDGKIFITRPGETTETVEYRV